MIASVAAALTLLLLQLLLPHKPKPLADYDKLILLNEYKYKIYEIFSLVPLFFFVSVICYFFYALGNDVQELVFAGRATDFASDNKGQHPARVEFFTPVSHCSTFYACLLPKLP